MRLEKITKFTERLHMRFAALLAASIVLSAIFGCAAPTTAYAAVQWPTMSSIEAEGGILIDAATGTVLFAKNENQQFYPASITKILTALLVIENCEDLDEEFTFSHRAVYDVEANSQNCGYDEGDVISVRDALYAMMLQSANEVANGLAEHIGGSIEGFADMMNEYAASVGCTNSHFANPSGLNNPDHYTTASDYARICRMAFANEIFCEIDGTRYYKLPPSKRNPDGLTVYTHHGMLKKNNENYYPDAVGGKTGYTSLAGNTLVTCARRDGLKLITVVLNGHQTHYKDTKAMLDFGFDSFQSLSVRSHEQNYAEVYDVLDITSEGVDGIDILTPQADASVILPKDAQFSELERTITYLDAAAISKDGASEGAVNASAAGGSTAGTAAATVSTTGTAGGSTTGGIHTGGYAQDDTLAGAVARITYTYDGRVVGTDYLTADLTQPQLPPESETDAQDAQDAQEQEAQAQKQESGHSVWFIAAVAAGVPVLIAGIAVLVIYIIRRRREADMMIPGMGRGTGRLGGIGADSSGLGGIDSPGSIGSTGSLGRVRGRSRRRRR